MIEIVSRIIGGNLRDVGVRVLSLDTDDLCDDHQTAMSVTPLLIGD